MSLTILQANGDLVEDISNIRHAEGDSHTWTLQYRDLPEVVQPGRRQITSRLMADVHISSGDPVGFMEALDYTYVTLRYASLSIHSLTIIYYKAILQRTSWPGTVLHICLPRSFFIVSFCPRTHSKMYLMARARRFLRLVFWILPVRTFCRQQCAYRMGPRLRL